MRWLRRKWSVATQNPLFWANLVLILTVGAVASCGGKMWGVPDLYLRLLGIFLELVGVGTVWLDLSRSAKEVGRDGVIKRTITWLGVLVLNRPRIVSAELVISSSIVFEPRVLQRVLINKQAPLEERLDAVENYLAQIDQDMDAALNRVDTVSRNFVKGLAEEQSNREAQVDAVSKKLADVAAGSYAMLLFGVFWLSAGLLISGLSGEIVMLKTRWGF